MFLDIWKIKTYNDYGPKNIKKSKNRTHVFPYTAGALVRRRMGKEFSGR